MKWMHGGLARMCSVLPALLLLTDLALALSKSAEFSCYTDYSLADKPDDFLAKTRMIFGRPCECLHDWKSVFCDNLARYSQMNPNQAPSVCVCRKIEYRDKHCRQFMVRCFAQKENNYQTCQCCFNQPDDHCRQLDCRNLEPDFGRGMNTSCACHDQANYPVEVCSNPDVSPRTRGRQTPALIVQRDNNHIPTDFVARGRWSFLATVWQEVCSNAVLTVGIILFVAAVIGGCCFACGVVCKSRTQSARARGVRRESRPQNEKRLLETAPTDDVDRYLP